MTPYLETTLGKLYNSDCIEFYKTLVDDSVDLVFTSPPYNIGGSKTGKGACQYSEYTDDLSDEDYYILLKSFLEQSLRVCKGPVFLNINYMNSNKRVLYRILYEFVDSLRENIIWDKGRVQPPIGNILGKRYEYIFMFTKDPKFEINNFRQNKAIRYTKEFGNWISNLVEVSLETDQTKFSKTHKAGFPWKLPSIFIDIYTKENDIVLDPFFGLGSTAMAAELLNRRWIGCELIEKYCAIAKERIAITESRLL